MVTDLSDSSHCTLSLCIFKAIYSSPGTAGNAFYERDRPRFLDSPESIQLNEEYPEICVVVGTVLSNPPTARHDEGCCSLIQFASQTVMRHACWQSCPDILLSSVPLRTLASTRTPLFSKPRRKPTLTMWSWSLLPVAQRNRMLKIPNFTDARPWILDRDIYSDLCSITDCFMNTDESIRYRFD
jgi:hypothetical protein